MQNSNKFNSVRLYLIVLFAGASPVFACLCNPVSASERVRIMNKEATVILVGNVSKVVREDAGVMNVIIQAEKVWKSPLPLQKEYTVATSYGCAVDFRTGSSYLVYALLEKDRLITDVCLGTALIEFRKEDIRKLGKPIESYKVLRGPDAGAQENIYKLDRSKPSVYVELEKRLDLENSESGKLEYYSLRLKNNSVWGITIDASGGIDEAIGDITVYYDVVGRSENIVTRQRCHACSIITIGKGEVVRFLVPTSHLRDRLSIRIPFSFAWEDPKMAALGTEPAHYVSFTMR